MYEYVLGANLATKPTFPVITIALISSSVKIVSGAISFAQPTNSYPVSAFAVGIVVIFEPCSTTSVISSFASLIVPCLFPDSSFSILNLTSYLLIS